MNRSPIGWREAMRIAAASRFVVVGGAFVGIALGVAMFDGVLEGSRRAAYVLLLPALLVLVLPVRGWARPLLLLFVLWMEVAGISHLEMRDLNPSRTHAATAETAILLGGLHALAAAEGILALLAASTVGIWTERRMRPREIQS